MMLHAGMVEQVSAVVRVLRVISWVFAALPIVYFVILCTMAADARSGLGTAEADAGALAWSFWVKRLCAHIGTATFAPPTL